jgi:hypothetical protein
MAAIAILGPFPLRYANDENITPNNIHCKHFSKNIFAAPHRTIGG